MGASLCTGAAAVQVDPSQDVDAGTDVKGGASVQADVEQAQEPTAARTEKADEELDSMEVSTEATSRRTSKDTSRRTSTVEEPKAPPAPAPCASVTVRAAAGEILATVPVAELPVDFGTLCAAVCRACPRDLHPAQMSLALSDGTRLGPGRRLTAADMEAGGCSLTLDVTELPCCTKFVCSYGGPIGENGRTFSGAWFCHPGPSLARCSREETASCKLVLRIVNMAHRSASLTVGVHTEVPSFFTDEKERMGQGRHVDGSGVGARRRRQSKRGSRETLRWCNGDIIKLCLLPHLGKTDGPNAEEMILRWWHNGVPQAPITGLPASESWCFHVQGERMEVRIEEDDLGEDHYLDLRNSHKARLAAMDRVIKNEVFSDSE